MAIIDELNLVNLRDVPTSQVDKVRREISRRFWSWYRNHKDDEILRRRVAFWSLVIRARDLHFLFENIFGPETVA